MEEKLLNERDYEILNENHPNPDSTFKILVIGSVGVGKSCLSIRATKKKFEAHDLTMTIETFTFKMRYKEKVINLQILDTCGQDIYRSLISNYYNCSSLAVIVYAIDE